jgi:S1-C subfamily serine protease
MVLARALRVNSIYFYATDSAMRFNFRLLAVIAISAVSGITFAQSSGTAFVVAPGLLVTNHHVIEGCGAIEVIAPDGKLLTPVEN